MSKHEAATPQRQVLIVDDHQLIRHGMAQVLRQAFDDTGIIEAATFDDAAVQIATPGVFLAIVDLSIPGMASPLTLEKLRRTAPGVKLVVLSGSEARADMLAALEAGVHGYILKTERTDRLIGHLKHVLDGEIYLPPAVAELSANATIVPADLRPPPPALAALTKRQREVLVLVAEGLSNKEIGLRLEVAEGTVKMHVATILRVIDAKNRAHAAAIGRQAMNGGTTA